MADWQPIETAPKDGRAILLYSESWELTFGGVQVARWGERTNELGEWEFDSGMNIVVEDQDEEFDDYSPTHWQPLPEPPK